LLIDKDLTPKWSVSPISQVPQSLIDEHFVGFWEGAGQPHPLADLATLSVG
jgi:hypothetical protein